MPSKLPKTTLIYLLLSLLLLGLDQLGWLSPLKAKAALVTTPVKSQLWQGYKKFNWFRQERSDTPSRSFLQEKIALLEADNLSLQAQLQKEHDENQAMRQLLGAPLPAKWQFVVAQMIGQQGAVITINVGKEQGVQEKEAVVVENVLVGEVVEVLPKTSRVRLVNHPEFSAQAQVRESNLSGKIKVHGSRIFLEEVPLSEKLKSGSLIVRRDDGLVMGTVGKIVSSDKEQWQTAEVVWPIDILKLREVFVVKTGQ